MDAFLAQVAQSTGSYVPSFVGALAVLVLGWLAALIISAVVRGGLRRTELDNKLVRFVLGDEASEKLDVERTISRTVYYLILLFVLVAFFQALKITVITEPINQLLTRVFDFAPRVFAAGVLLAVAWVVASVLRKVLTRVLAAAKVDERFGSQAGLESGKGPAVSTSLADLVYWLVFLLFLPGVLSALALQGILDPVRGMLEKLLGFLPSLFGAGVILFIGWFLARIVQRIVTSVLSAAGADRLGERVGLDAALGKQRLSGLIGLIVYVLILVPVLIAALNALALEAITTPASNMLNTLLAAVPQIFGAVLILALAYAIARVIADLVTRLLAAVGFNGILVKIGLTKRELTDEKRTPAAVVGSIVLTVVMLLAFTESFRMLGFATVGDLLAQFIVVAGHILFGLVIFGIGLYLANLAARAVETSASSQAGHLALVARSAIIMLAGAMALRQMGLANEIVNLAFGLLLGAVAVAAALAFGLGGRDAAARKLEQWQKPKE